MLAYLHAHLVTFGIVAPAFLVAVLHRTRVFLIGGFAAIIVGFVCLSDGPLYVLAGIGIIVYGFLLLLGATYLRRRYLQRSMPPVPLARVEE
jgi:hypothetical protein